MRKKKSKISDEWAEAFQEYEDRTGFEILSLAEVESGEMSPRQAWDRSVNWIRRVADDAQNIRIPIEDT